MRFVPGLLLVALVTAAAGAGCRGERATKPVRYDPGPIIIISIDTLRADRLPAYGYDGVRTPHIDALRADGVLFSHAYTHVPLTLPAHLSLFTGELPAGHGVRNNIGYRYDPARSRSFVTDLRENGYATGGAISAYVLRSSTGISEGFDFYEEAIASRTGAAIGSLQRPGGETAAAAEPWIDSVASRPFLFFLHLFEPHSPYEPPEPFRTQYAASPYDGEVAAADAIVGGFIEGLKRRGLYDRATIILLSDHGESLGEHGEPEHGVFLYRQTIHVPLIVKLPGHDRRGETLDHPVGLIDIAPTVLEIAGILPGRELPGRSLFSPSSRQIFSESFYGRIHLGWSELRSLIDDRYHYIEAPRPELYSVPDDPHSTRSILSEQRRVYASMREAMAPYRADLQAPSDVDPEERARLAALGYLGSTASPTSGPLPDPKDKISELGEMVAAASLTQSGRIDEGVAALRRIVAKSPGFGDAWNMMALALDNDGRPEEAAEAYRRAIEATPTLAPEFALSLSSILLNLERFDDAEAHARLAEKTNPAGMHLLLARIALKRGRPEVAEREARAAMADNYARHAAKVMVAQSLVDRSRLPEALAAVQEVEREAIQPVETLQFTKGDILARMERYDEAIAAFRREIELFPERRQPYANLALVYMLQGRRGEARAVFEDLSRRLPGRRTYLFNAEKLEQLDDAGAAAEWRRRANATR
jgi:choline-sulfatase